MNPSMARSSKSSVPFQVFLPEVWMDFSYFPRVLHALRDTQSYHCTVSYCALVFRVRTPLRRQWGSLGSPVWWLCEVETWSRAPPATALCTTRPPWRLRTDLARSHAKLVTPRAVQPHNANCSNFHTQHEGMATRKTEVKERRKNG
jgi:hypothetical protein